MIPEKYQISEKQINKYWFGEWGDEQDKRFLILDALLKHASGYVSGYTITKICKNLGLLEQDSTHHKNKFTDLGRGVMYFWALERINGNQK